MNLRCLLLTILHTIRKLKELKRFEIGEAGNRVMVSWVGSNGVESRFIVNQ